MKTDNKFRFELKGQDTAIIFEESGDINLMMPMLDLESAAGENLLYAYTLFSLCFNQSELVHVSQETKDRFLNALEDALEENKKHLIKESEKSFTVN